MYPLSQIVNSIQTINTKWDNTYSNILTFSFKTEKMPYEPREDHIGFEELNYTAKNATRQIIEYISSLTNITFVEKENGGNIVISSKYMNDSYLGYAYYPGDKNINSSAGDLYLNNSFNNTDYGVGGIAWSTLLHELGHTLGLSHPYDQGDFPNIDINDTVMSYNPYIGYDSFNNRNYEINSYASFQEADIKALQEMYGKNINYENTTFDMSKLIKNDSSKFILDNLFTIYDYDGIDLVDISGLTGNSPQYLDINKGSQSVLKFNNVFNYINITSDTIIENVTGSFGNDTIILNDTNNHIDGKEGFDKVYINTNSDFRIDVLDNYTIVSSTSGFDTLVSIENLHINSNEIDLSNYQREQLSISEHSIASSLSRLYLSTFNRLADKDGLNYWVNEINLGMELIDISNLFILSNEFETRYSSQTNNEYINLLYSNILNREPDEGGLKFWEEYLEEGNSKASILTSFSQSDEFINITSVYFEDNLITIL